MKQIKLLIGTLFFMILKFTGHAQVGVGTDSPDASALLDVSGTTGGFLPPRLTYNQMHNIISPAEGLMLYCTDCYPKGMYYFDGSDFLSGITGNTSVVPATAPKAGGIRLGGSLVPFDEATGSIDAMLYDRASRWKQNYNIDELKASDSILKLTN